MKKFITALITLTSIQAFAEANYINCATADGKREVSFSSSDRFFNKIDSINIKNNKFLGKDVVYNRPSCRSEVIKSKNTVVKIDCPEQALTASQSLDKDQPGEAKLKIKKNPQTFTCKKKMNPFCGQDGTLEEKIRDCSLEEKSQVKSFILISKDKSGSFYKETSKNYYWALLSGSYNVGSGYGTCRSLKKESSFKLDWKLPGFKEIQAAYDGGLAGILDYGPYSMSIYDLPDGLNSDMHDLKIEWPEVTNWEMTFDKLGDIKFHATAPSSFIHENRRYNVEAKTSSVGCFGKSF